MQAQTPSTDTYVLGHAPEAIQRLLKQGQLLSPFTRRAFADAGITAGMNVLDVGCGPGDVTLLVAEMVGATGHVLGIDANPAVLRLAEARAQEAGTTHVSFRAGDIRDWIPDQDYDAIVGRLILMYLPERAAILRRLAQRLRPGGVLAFQEYDISSDSHYVYPSSFLWQQVHDWITQGFGRAGAELQMGLKVYGSILEAGLPAPQLRYEAIIAGGPESPVYEFVAEVVRAMAPMLVKLGIATAEEVDIETLADRLRDAIVSQQGVARTPGIVSAWVRKV
ncbi:MAG TPA: class I SAM-dependent methyltransferase [Ktedonobacterales bacterium]|nr:class I SAM-dependent methyltransferase [Ktedonobacterales bacterium]